MYPPIAARSTASEAWHVARVSGGRGTPVASMAAPPTSASVNSNAMSYCEPTSSSTSRAVFMISGPMPSPGRRVILYDFAAADTANARRARTAGGLTRLPAVRRKEAPVDALRRKETGAEAAIMA